MRREGDTVFKVRFLCETGCAVAFVLSFSTDVLAQQRKVETPVNVDDERASLGQSLSFTEQLLARKIDEQMLFQTLS